MSYREEHNEMLAKKIYEELKLMPDVCRYYIKYLDLLLFQIFLKSYLEVKEVEHES